jgi:RNA polymerase sigma factor for flagellar operon FliA
VADDEANRFASEYQGFVRSIALRVRAELDLTVDLDDLVGFGFQGLIEAKGRFDASRGVQFNTFAYYRVRGAVIDGVRKMAYMPRHMHRLRKTAEAMDWALEEAAEARAAGVAPTTAEDAAELALRQMDDVLGKLTASFVIAAVGQDEESQRTDAEEMLIARESQERVKKALEVLPEREKIVVMGMYFEGRNLDDIGAQLGISRSWACRLHTKGLALMRAALEREES